MQLIFLEGICDYEGNQETPGYQFYYPNLLSLLDMLNAFKGPSMAPVMTVYEYLLQRAHIIRVWLLLPQQALTFY
jgi:hypothetical protein